MEKYRFNPEPAIELLRMPYHLAKAFRALIEAAEAETSQEKLILMGVAQEQVDQELVRLRLLLQKPEPTERLFGAVLDPDYDLVEDALSEAYLLRDSLSAKKDDRKP
jgi:hypothetical protein